MAIKIIKNPRYRIEQDGEIVGFFKYKKKAQQKVKSLKQIPTSKIVSIPKKIDTKIVFPTEWKHPRTKRKVIVKQPKVFISKKDWEKNELVTSLGIYMNAKNPKYNPSGDMGNATWELEANDLPYTVKQLDSYVKTNKVDPNKQWISRSQIVQLTKVLPQEVDTSKSQMDNYYQYWFLYEEAVKEVKRLKGGK